VKLDFSLLSDTDIDGGQRGTRGTPMKSGVKESPVLSHLPPQPGDRPLDAARRPPVSPTCPTARGTENTLISSVSHLSPVVPLENGLTGVDWELFEERAVIMEFDGGLTRFDAELRAAVLTGARVAIVKPYRERN
jgi:hypothetical protein